MQPVSAICAEVDHSRFLLSRLWYHVDSPSKKINSLPSASGVDKLRHKIRARRARNEAAMKENQRLSDGCGVTALH